MAVVVVIDGVRCVTTSDDLKVSRRQSCFVKDRLQSVLFRVFRGVKALLLENKD